MSVSHSHSTYCKNKNRKWLHFSNFFHFLLLENIKIFKLNCQQNNDVDFSIYQHHSIHFHDRLIVAFKKSERCNKRGKDLN